MDPLKRRSLELKVEKALQAKQHLQEEEALMLGEAVRRHAADERPEAAYLPLAPKAEPYRQDLADQLQAMPYLSMAQVGWEDGRWKKHLLLYRGGTSAWSKPYHGGEKAATTAERAKIANGFELPAGAHWGQTKGTHTADPAAARQSNPPARQRAAAPRRGPCPRRARPRLQRHCLLVRG